MKPAASRLCGWIFLSILGFYSFNGYGGHMIGTDISYQYVSPGTYLIKVRWYRDCQGLPSAPQINICYSSVSCATSGSTTLTFAGPGVFLPPCPYLPPVVSSCNGGSGFGIERVEYTGLVNLPATCNDWIISYSTFPQNVGMNNNFLYVDTKIDNINHPVNSSPNHTFDPVFIFCANQPAWNNYAATDADGDSLSYHIDSLLDNTTVCPPAPFQNPMQPFYLLQSSTPIAMDALNGSLTFTPTTLQSAFSAVRIDEFRSGVLINSSTIEHQIFIVAGCVISGMEDLNRTSTSVYPNPAKDILNINFEGPAPLQIEAFDLSGKVFNLTFASKQTSALQADVSNLSPGVYFLRIINDKGTYVKRIVKS